jgi:hypothetical protein
VRGIRTSYTFFIEKGGDQMMVVGLYSGEQLIVRDRSYFIQVNQATKQVFISEDGNRRFIVDEARIEFYNEVNSQDYIDKIHESIERTVKNQKAEKEGMDYV